MRTGSAQPFPRSRHTPLVLLLGLAGAAWAVSIWQANTSREMPMGPVFFLATWATMMAAMMFPSAAPMVLTFRRLQAGRRQLGSLTASTLAFVAGYLAVWTAFGVLALAARTLLESAGLILAGRTVTGGLLVVAGLYQLSPWKHACLSSCRTPLGFLLGSWRNGVGGAFQMGLQHGLYCLGCCWLLFALLLPLGLMNLAAMTVLTLLVSAEKLLPLGDRFARAVGIGLAAAGLMLLAS